MALTTSGTLSQVVKNYYDKRFLQRAVPLFVYRQLGRLGVVPQHEGKTVIWTRFTNPAVKTALTEGTDPTPAGLSALNVTATLTPYGNYEQVTDILSLTAIDNMIAAAVDLLATEAANSIDRPIRTAITDGGTALYASGVANRTSIAATNVVTVADIRKAVRKLRQFNAPAHTAGHYMGVIHPDVEYDLQGDSNWVYAHQYVESGIKNIWNGVAGRLYGVEFLRTSEAPVLTNSGSADTEVYLSHIMGNEFVGVSELVGLTTFVDSPSPRSPLRLYSDVGWKCTFATKVLNASFGVQLESAATQ